MANGRDDGGRNPVEETLKKFQRLPRERGADLAGARAVMSEVARMPVADFQGE